MLPLPGSGLHTAESQAIAYTSLQRDTKLLRRRGFRRWKEIHQQGQQATSVPEPVRTSYYCPLGSHTGLRNHNRGTAQGHGGGPVPNMAGHRRIRPRRTTILSPRSAESNQRHQNGSMVVGGGTQCTPGGLRSGMGHTVTHVPMAGPWRPRGARLEYGEFHVVTLQNGRSRLVKVYP